VKTCPNTGATMRSARSASGTGVVVGRRSNVLGPGCVLVVLMSIPLTTAVTGGRSVHV
jgi:hypothetical protein